jgi:D-arginine dehydrogenase
MFIASYGPAQVRALTRASRAFLQNPPAGFVDQAILTARGTLTVAQPGQEVLLDALWEGLRSGGMGAQRLSAKDTGALVPALRVDRVAGAVSEPDAADIDVHALHQAYLRGMRRHGGKLVCDAPVEQLTRCGALWQAHSGARVFQAPVVVNAAGAWCDVVGTLAGAKPIGLVPKRRSAFVFEPPAGLDCARWPLCLGVDESWYFKPDGGQLLGSPANADAVCPQDVQPEEFDIALGIQRIEAMTTFQIRRPRRTWAGLRSFAPDGELVGGFDPDLAGFFWLAGQGGYGIQTSAAMGEACALQVRGLPMSARLSGFGLTAEGLSPKRLREGQ